MDFAVQRERLFRYAVPALLCGIALWQQYQSHRNLLSPWKGGGFGMFSTVDSPSTRFVRVYLVTEDGEIPVPPPTEFTLQLREVRTIPSRDRLVALTRELAAVRWVSGTVPLVPPWYSDDNDANDDPDSSLDDSGLTSAVQAETALQIPVFRTLAEGETVPLGGKVISFQSVRVELWRYQFDSSSAQIASEQLLDASAARESTKE